MKQKVDERLTQKINSSCLFEWDIGTGNLKLNQMRTFGETIGIFLNFFSMELIMNEYNDFDFLFF